MESMKHQRLQVTSKSKYTIVFQNVIYDKHFNPNLNSN